MVWKEPIEFGIDWRAGINAERFWGGIDVDKRYRSGEGGEGGCWDRWVVSDDAVGCRRVCAVCCLRTCPAIRAARLTCREKDASIFSKSSNVV